MKSYFNALTRIFYKGPYVWETDLSPADAVQKIKSLQEGSFLTRMFSPGFATSIFGNYFTVKLWGIDRRPRSYNSFVHVLVGEVRHDGSRTVIRGKFRLHAFVFIFMLFWFGIIFLIGGAYLLHSNPIDPSVLLFFLIMLIGGTGVVLGGRSLARSNEEEILDALKARFGAPTVKPDTLKPAQH